MRSPGVLFAVAPLLLAACTPSRDGSDLDAVEDSVRAQQRAVTAQALEALESLPCPDLPEQTRLQGVPDVRLDCLGPGAARSVRAGDGRPTVVNLWASWCRPCVDELPLLQRTSKAAGADVRFVGVDTQDERAGAGDLLRTAGVTYPSYDDPEGRVRAGVRAVGLPTTLVFDARGREVARRYGKVTAAWMAEALTKAGAGSGRPAA